MNLRELADAIDASDYDIVEPLTEFAPVPGMGWMFLADPDGNWIELYGSLRASRALREHPRRRATGTPTARRMSAARGATASSAVSACVTPPSVISARSA
jgi:hypothetical protein